MGYGNPAPVATVADLQAHVSQLLGDTLVLENSPRRAAAAARLIVVAAHLITDGDVLARVEALEERVQGLAR